MRRISVLSKTLNESVQWRSWRVCDNHRRCRSSNSNVGVVSRIKVGGNDLIRKPLSSLPIIPSASASNASFTFSQRLTVLNERTRSGWGWALDIPIRGFRSFPKPELSSMGRGSPNQDSASKNAPSGELKVKQVEVGLADLSLLGKQTISQLGMSGKKALDELKFASSETSSSSTPSEKDPITTRVPPLPPGRKKRVKKFFLFKFFDFVQQYPKILEKRFPGAMNVYRVFMVGVKDFARDLTDYLKISTKVLLASNGIRGLNSAELDVYYRMPKEIVRVAPTLLISALPFMNYVMFPIAYYFPKTLLSSHFWSIQQKSQFAVDFQKKRLQYYRPVFRCLQANVELVRDPIMKKKCQDVLDKLGSGVHPSSREIMEIKPLFESDPFSLKAIYGPHVKGLCRVHGMLTLILNRRRLYDKAEMLLVMDAAMLKDGIYNMKTEELKSACFLRGLNASNTTNQDMVEYLQQWSSISSTIGPHSYSLLLHLPILIAYNNPNNWALLMGR